MSGDVIYHNPRCSTSRKTLELLRAGGLAPTVIEYLKAPPSRKRLAQLIRDAGIDVRDAVRENEEVYRQLNLDDAGDEELLDAMVAHPILIQRPFVITAKGTRLARPVDVVREIL
jgi:arsenate reductase